jgi:hypothetical protein
LINELIHLGRYRLAARIASDALRNIKSWRKDVVRRMIVINRAQSIKWAGEDERCVEMLEYEDWSASSKDFRLACAVLRGNFQRARDLMILLGDNAEYADEEAYHLWPLFREFRSTSEFQEAFEEVFGKEFESSTPGRNEDA